MAQVHHKSEAFTDRHADLSITIIPPIQEKKTLPHILRGASNSSRIGWLRKSSLDLRHRPRISASVNCTFLPGRVPRTENKRQINFHYFYHIVKKTLISSNFFFPIIFSILFQDTCILMNK